MKTIKNYILESKGAPLVNRTWDRFFGDDLSKPIGLKHAQARAIKFLKENKDQLNDEEYNFLTKLATNKFGQYDARSYCVLNKHDSRNYTRYIFDFTINTNNLSDSIKNQLSSKVIAKKFNLELTKNVGLWADSAGGYDCNIHGFGVTQTLYIRYSTHNGENEKLFWDLIHYICETLLPIKDDILNFKDEYKDKEVVKDKKS